MDYEEILAASDPRTPERNVRKRKLSSDAREKSVVERRRRREDVRRVGRLSREALVREEEFLAKSAASENEDEVVKDAPESGAHKEDEVVEDLPESGENEEDSPLIKVMDEDIPVLGADKTEAQEDIPSKSATPSTPAPVLTLREVQELQVGRFPGHAFTVLEIFLASDNLRFSRRPAPVPERVVIDLTGDEVIDLTGNDS